MSIGSHRGEASDAAFAVRDLSLRSGRARCKNRIPVCAGIWFLGKAPEAKAAFKTEAHVFHIWIYCVCNCLIAFQSSSVKALNSLPFP